LFGGFQSLGTGLATSVSLFCAPTESLDFVIEDLFDASGEPSTETARNEAGKTACIVGPQACDSDWTAC
jgi:hypothetical protein